MDMAIKLARVFGPFMGIMGLWMLLYGENLTKIMASMKSDPADSYIISTINLLVGLFIISAYNVWVWDIFFFVTLLGWWFVIRGVLGLFMPQLVVKMLMTRGTWMKTMGIVPFVWGLILTWIGFYM